MTLGQTIDLLVDVADVLRGLGYYQLASYIQNSLSYQDYFSEYDMDQLKEALAILRAEYVPDIDLIYNLSTFVAP